MSQNENWVKAKSGMKKLVPMLAVGTGIILGYALIVRIFVLKR